MSPRREEAKGPEALPPRACEHHRASHKALGSTHARVTFALILSTLALVGCSDLSITAPSLTAGTHLQGSIYGGQQPVVGSHVYLMAASSAGYGSASNSLLTSGTDGTDRRRRTTAAPAGSR